MKSQHPGRLLSAARCLPLTAALLICSCSDAEPAPAATLSVGATYDALAKALDACEDEKRACRDATGCEEAELEVCEAAFRECREAARPARDAMREAARACRDGYETCKEVAAEDEVARDACRGERDICMAASRPPKPPCHAALDACLDAARASEPASEPDNDAGVGDEACKPRRRRHTRSEAEEACHEAAHACIEAEKAAKPPVDPPKCGPKHRPRPDGGVESLPPTAADGPAAGGKAPRDDEHPLPPHCRAQRRASPPPAAGEAAPKPARPRAEAGGALPPPRAAGADAPVIPVP